MSPTSPRTTPWVAAGDTALLTDFYELTMLQAYWHEGLDQEAVFSLFFRELPRGRNFMLACGLADALAYLEGLHFDDRSLAYLESLGRFRPDFLDWLGRLRFTGDVHAVAEGTPVFPQEPLLEVVAPLPQAQLVETFLMNTLHLQTVLASKAARVVLAASGRRVVDFGLRRMHGVDAGLKSARAFHIAGVAATSNVLAGLVYGLEVTGTMAHSYIQAHPDEASAFRAFIDLYPDTVLLVDTYDTLEGVRQVVALARERGDEFQVRALRLDSGDLATLALEARRLLDEAGLGSVGLFASGSLDEHRIADLLTQGAPFDGFGVGTRMGVSRDAPSLELVYKLTAYAGRGRFKQSPGKALLPFRKQVHRVEESGRAVRDVLARYDEPAPGRPLLEPVMKAGRILPAGRTDLDAAQRHAREEIAKLPSRVRALAQAHPPYPVEVSDVLQQERDRMEEVLKS